MGIEALVTEQFSAGFDCKSCGACCSYSAEWPRFSTEDEAKLERIPARYVAGDESGMLCDGARCAALVGEVGKSTSCSIYEIRPDVCRACMPGGNDCLMARQKFFRSDGSGRHHAECPSETVEL